jgi:hypothetical protein
VLIGGGRGEPAESSRVFQPRHERGLRRRADRQGAFFVEVNHQMPRTQGLNQIHVSRMLGWCERDAPLVAIPPAVRTSATG